MSPRVFAPPLPPDLDPDNLTPQQVQRLLDSLDVPACRCKLVKVHRCVTARHPEGCAERSRQRCLTKKHPDGCPFRRKHGFCDCPARGRCDCAYWLRPCVHILQKEINLSLDEWAALLLSLQPDQYDDPPPPLTPMWVLDQDSRVATYIERNGCTCGRCVLDPITDKWITRYCEGVGLWHEEDLFQEDNEEHEELGCGPKAQTGPNGAGRRKGKKGDPVRKRDQPLVVTKPVPSRKAA